MSQPTRPEPTVYQGQFGEFSITQHDRQEVLIYRSGLVVAALCFGVGATLALMDPNGLRLQALTVLYAGFWAALGVSLWTIHIYMGFLHRTLQAFWAIGGLASLALGFWFAQPLALTVYAQPLSIVGVGFTFAALTGIFFKEAFCFNRLETKGLTLLVPTLLLGHLLGWLPLVWERWLLVVWAVLFAIFALRKVVQPIPPDIGDKSVFVYLRSQRA